MKLVAYIPAAVVTVLLIVVINMLDGHRATPIVVAGGLVLLWAAITGTIELTTRRKE